MKIIPAVALTVETAHFGVMNFCPVSMKKRANSSTERWQKFLLEDGRRIPLSQSELARCQVYMKQFGTDAIAHDKTIAYAVGSNALIECQPDLLEELDAAAEAAEAAEAAAASVLTQ